MSFSQGLSGLTASASNLDVIGNNIANSGTVGFKSGTVQFADVFTGTQIGLGAKVSAVSQNFNAGAVQTSARVLDVAIVEGDGFFRMKSPGGEIAYSRNGQFNKDKDGFIVNAAGLQLTGHKVDAAGVVGVGLEALQLPSSAMLPKATGEVVSQFNLDARGTIPTAAFNANNSATYNYSNSVRVYDSLGNPHELATFFVKTSPVAPSTSSPWDVYATADGVAVPGPAASNRIGQLTFDAFGQLVLPASGKMALNGIDFANGSAPMTVNVAVTGTTQFGSASDVKQLDQDGYASGTLAGFSIGKDGILTGKYTNEQSKALGQIVLSSFVNPAGLESKGDNVWTETAASGQSLTGNPGAGTKLGALASGALEASNVDLTSELVNLIIAQRTYQANAQTVKTQDQVVQTLMNLR
jgi:flagellar hook protein FlgE